MRNVSGGIIPGSGRAAEGEDCAQEYGDKRDGALTLRRWSEEGCGTHPGRTRARAAPSANVQAGETMTEKQAARGADTAADRAPVWVNITQELEKSGFTPICFGCRMWLVGKSRQGHSELCRRCLKKEMRSKPKMTQVRAWESAFLDSVLRREDKARTAGS